ncbi:MAG: DUF4229 domain-containing protein [Microbacteriaceae bacterium]|nr:DUF4229 domain-containing protein [Microbacteriaceae bacterium]
MNAWTRILVFSIIRIVFFAAPLTGLLLIGFNEIWAAVIAAVIGLLLSIIFLPNQRDKVSEAIGELREKSDSLGEDEEYEDRF